MSLVRLLGGVTQADHDALSKEVKRLKNLVEGPGSDQELLREATNAAISAQQDANSAAHSATLARQDAGNAQAAATTAAAAFDALNESLAEHGTQLGDLDRRVTALEGGGVVQPEPGPGPQPGQPDLSLRATAPPALTGEAAALAQAALWYAENGQSHFDKPITWVTGQDDVYTLARTLRDRVSNVLQCFRASKDLRLLDAAARWIGATRINRRVGYRGHGSQVTWPASPFPCYVAGADGQMFDGEPRIKGTDLSVMNEVKWHATIAEVAYALHLNGARTSPGGLDYGQEADDWIDYLVNAFLPKWTGGGTSGWRADYRGVRRSPTYANGSGGGPQRHGRPAEGEWPVCINGGEFHSSLSAMLLAHFMHLLTGSEAARVERDWLARNLAEVETPQVPSPTGTARVWRQAWRSQGSDSVLAERATYVGYPVSDLVTARLEGIPHITDDLLIEMFRSVRHFMWLPNVTDGAAATIITRGDICGGVTRGPVQAHNGSPRTQGQALYFNYLSSIPWEPTGYLEAEAHRLHAQSWSGGWAQPRTLAATTGRLLKAALS